MTTTSTTARPRRPRPTTVERNIIRVRPQIKFKNRDESTTEAVEEVTEQIFIPDEEEALTETGTTQTNLFAAIFGNNESPFISTTTPIPTATKSVDHRVLDSVKITPDVEEEAVPQITPNPATEPAFRFEDLFTPTPPVTVEKVPLSFLTTSAARTEPTTKPASTTPRRTAPPPDYDEVNVFITSPPSRGLPRLPPTTSVASSTTPRTTSPRRGGRPPAPRSSTVRPTSQIADYIYDTLYDDDAGALGGTLGELADLTEKALLLPGGKVKCYDTGYFAHPESCKKFISCSKTVRGAVRGWVYTCPQQLVFDPVGGMCNWAEAVDCKAPII